MLSLAQSANGTTTLACEFAKTPAPGRVEIVRVRRPFAARDIGTMGPAIHESEPPAWQALDESGRPAASAAATSRFRFAFADTTPPSWFPYFYRAVAIGANDVTTGLVAGRSLQSNMVSVEKLPKTLPMIEGAEGVQAGPQRASLRFRSDALIDETPNGSFLLEVHAYDFRAGDVRRDAGAEGVPSAHAAAARAAALTPGALFASAPDAAGVRTFEAVFDVASGPFMLRARLTDPLGRASERIVSGSVEAIDPPNLDDLRLRRNLRDLLIRFTSTTSPQPPPNGAYRLVISFIRDGVGRSRDAADRDVASRDSGRRSGRSQELAGHHDPARSRAAAAAAGPVRRGDQAILSAGTVSGAPQGRVRVTMTAPDGTIGQRRDGSLGTAMLQDVIALLGIANPQLALTWHESGSLSEDASLPMRLTGSVGEWRAPAAGLLNQAFASRLTMPDGSTPSGQPWVLCLHPQVWLRLSRLYGVVLEARTAQTDRPQRPVPRYFAYHGTSNIGERTEGRSDCSWRPSRADGRQRQRARRCGPAD